MPRLTHEQREAFLTTGFLVLRGLLGPDEAKGYFAELEAFLRASFGGSYDGTAPHWAPATDLFTPAAAGLLADARFREVATDLLGRTVLGEGTDASFYVGDTRWHHDAVHRDLFEAVKFTLYGTPVNGESGALRLVPGSHRAPVHDRLMREVEGVGLRPDAWPAFVFDAEPGDAIVFDVRVWHGAFNGRCRLAGSVNFRIDPRTDPEIEACRSYFARSHRHVASRYGESLMLYPPHFRSLPHPEHRRWVARLAELGVLDAEAAS